MWRNTQFVQHALLGKLSFQKLYSFWMGHFRPQFPYFHLFNTVVSKYMVFKKIADGCIQTFDLWCQKQVATALPPEPQLPPNFFLVNFFPGNHVRLPRHGQEREPHLDDVTLRPHPDVHDHWAQLLLGCILLPGTCTIKLFSYKQIIARFKFQVHNFNIILNWHYRPLFRSFPIF